MCVRELVRFFIASTVVDVSMRCFTSVPASYNLWMCVNVCEWCFLKLLTILSIRAFLLLRFISKPMKMLLLNLSGLSKFVCVCFFSLSFYICTQTFNFRTVLTQQHSFRKWFQRIVSPIWKKKRLNFCDIHRSVVKSWNKHNANELNVHYWINFERIVALNWTIAINQCIVLTVFTQCKQSHDRVLQKFRRKKLHR